MDTPQNKNELTPYALNLIHQKARKLIGKAGYNESDFEDIKQDLTLEVVRCLPKFNPDKATYNTFIDRVIEGKICKLLRYLKCAETRLSPGSVFVQRGNLRRIRRIVQRAYTLGQDEHDQRTGRYSRSQGERTDMELDIKMALEALPPKLRKIAIMLQSYSISEAAKKLGIPQGTFTRNISSNYG